MRALAAAALKRKPQKAPLKPSEDGLSSAVKEAFQAMKKGDEKAFATAFKNAVTLASEE